MIRLPESWNDWQIVRQLGEGAFSTVYEAVRVDDPGIRAAIKVVDIPRDQAEVDELSVEGISVSDSNRYFESATEDLSREIRLMQQFKGMQNFVSIEDYKSVPKEGGIGFRVFIRMELLTPLDRWALDHRISERDVLRIGVDLCTALSFLEKKQLVHRDVKPANIFVNDTAGPTPFFKLGDFGIARSLAHRSQGLSSKGTPNYIAPEVAAAQPYDGRADLYSLGLTLYRLLNGNRLPFLPQQQLYTPAMRQEAVSRRLAGEPLPPPAHASAEAAAVILKACAYRPEDRYATAAEMRGALLALLERPQAGQAKPGRADKPDRPARKKRSRAWLIVPLLAALLAVGALVWLIATGAGAPPASNGPTAIPTAAPTAVPEETPTPAPPITTEEADMPETKPDTPLPTEPPTPAPTPDPTPTPSPSPSPTPSPSPSPTPTPSPSPVPTPEPTPTPKPIVGEFRLLGDTFMYQRPSDKSMILQQLARDTIVFVTGQTDAEDGWTWHGIRIGGLEGYIRADKAVPWDGVTPTPVPTAPPTATPTRIPTARFTRIPTEAPTQAPTVRPTPTPTAAPTPMPVPKPGSIVTFGSYMTDAKRTMSAIRWIIVEVDTENKSCVLLSEKVLDVSPFNQKGRANSRPKLHESSIGEWCSGVFFRTAFTAAERGTLLPITGKDLATGTKVAVPSKEEYLGWKTLLGSRAAAQATEYAVRVRGAHVTAVDGTDYAWWWLRSTPADMRYDYVNSRARVFSNNLDRPGGVRPMIRVPWTAVTGGGAR